MRESEELSAPEMCSEGLCPSMNHPGFVISTVSLKMSTCTQARDVQSLWAKALKRTSRTALGGDLGDLLAGTRPVYDEPAPGVHEDVPLRGPDEAEEGIGSTGHEPGGSKVQLTLENNIVARTLRQQHALEGRVPARALSDLGEYELAAVRIAFARGRVTASELAKRIGRTRRSASSVLKGLGTEGRGVLAWHGTATNDPRQYYTIA